MAEREATMAMRAMQKRERAIEEKRQRHREHIAKRSQDLARETAFKMERISQKQAAREAARAAEATQSAQRARENERQRLQKMAEKWGSLAWYLTQ